MALSKERRKEYAKAYYAANKEKAYENSRKHVALRKEWLNEQKSKPCSDCGGDFPPCVMDFHHRDSVTKVANVSRLLITKGRQAVLDEISKCDLVCANCHRIREHC